MSVETLAIKLTAVDLAGRVLDRMKGKLSAIRDGSEEVQKSYSKMIKGAKIAASAGFITKEITSNVSKMTKLSAGLEESMLRYKQESLKAGQALSDLTGEADALKSVAFEVQKATTFDMTGVLDIATILKKSGVSFESISGGALELAANLATVENVAPDTAGSIISLADSIFKLEEAGGDSFKNFGNYLSKATSLADLNVETFGQALTYAAKAKKDLKLDEKETSVAIAALAKGGLKGTLGGTSLSSFARELTTKKITRELAFGEDKQFVGMDKALLNLDEKLKSFNNDLDRSTYLQKAFGTDGKNAVQPLIDYYSKYYEEIDKGATIQEKVAVRLSGTNAQLESLGGTASSIGALLFEPLNESIGKGVGLLNEFVGGIGDVVNKRKGLADVASSIGAGTVAAGGLVTAGAGLFAAYQARKTLKGVGGIKGLFGKAASTSQQIAKAKALEKIAGTQSVFVVNTEDIGKAVAAHSGGGLGADVASGVRGRRAKGRKGGLFGSFADLLGFGGGRGSRRKKIKGLSRSIAGLGGFATKLGLAGVALFGLTKTVQKLSEREAHRAKTEEIEKRTRETRAELEGRDPSEYYNPNLAPKGNAALNIVGELVTPLITAATATGDYISGEDFEKKALKIDNLYSAEKEKARQDALKFGPGEVALAFTTIPSPAIEAIVSKALQDSTVLKKLTTAMSPLGGEKYVGRFTPENLKDIIGESIVNQIKIEISPDKINVDAGKSKTELKVKRLGTNFGE